jgi:ribulose-phosphate 3-epimerase
MIEVIPAILARDYNDLKNGIERFVGVTPYVQIDMCDGNFVNSISWPYNEIKSGDSRNLDLIMNEEEGLPRWEDMNFELDLMVHRAHEQFDFFMKFGPKRMVFHIEAEVDSLTTEGVTKFKEFIESIDLYTRDNVEIGVAINIATDVTVLDSIIPHVDFVQCMGIGRIGFQGESFDQKCIDQIKALHTSYPELIISVDGAVSDETAPQLVDAGATRLVVGSFLSQGYDTREVVEYLQSLA